MKTKDEWRCCGLRGFAGSAVLGGRSTDSGEQQEIWKAVAGETLPVRSESPIDVSLSTAESQKSFEPSAKRRWGRFNTAQGQYKIGEA